MSETKRQGSELSGSDLPDSILPILLAGGEGTRLRPITADLPKPLIPVDGVPAICRILDTLASLGVARAVITVRYLADRIIDCLGAEYAGIRLYYANEADAPRGTAGGVRDAWDTYASSADTDALVISGDAVFTCDLAAFAASHRRRNADASLLCVSVPDPGAFGIVNTDGQGRITAFSEKPCAAETLSDTVNTGIYCLTRAFLETVPQDGTPDFGQDVFPQALRRGDRLYAFESDDYWCDIGSFSAYLACSLDISAGRIPGVLTPRTHPQLPPHTSDCSVGWECFIPSSASVRGSILFDRVVIGAGASVSGSILCADVHIGDRTVIEPGCVVGGGCHIGDGLHLPRGTRLEPGSILQNTPQSPSGHAADIYAARDAFDGGAQLTPYLTDIGYALSVSAQPEPETAVAFARALAAFAVRQRCALFLCRAEDTPALHSLQKLVTEALACTEHVPGTLSVFCADDDVLPLSVARMPSLPLPDRQSEQRILRVVFLRRGSIPCAAIFDEGGLYPSRQTERSLDTCFSDALSAQYRPHLTEPLPITASLQPIHRVRTSDLTAVYLTRYAKGDLSAPHPVPFSFSCGSTPMERLLARLLCTIGGEENVFAPVHFSVREPWEDNGDILCPLSVTDLRYMHTHGQSIGYSHWDLLSHLTDRYQDNRPPRHFPTPRHPDPTAERQPLSIPVCAPLELHAEYRYSHAPALSDHAPEHDIPHLSRRYAAMEAEDAVLLARGIANLLSAGAYSPNTPTDSADEPLKPHLFCRYHGLAVTEAAPNRPLTLTANLSRLTKGETADFCPAVEGVVHRCDHGSVRIVATRDHNFRIIADAHTTEAAEELFRFAKDRLLHTVRSISKA